MVRLLISCAIVMILLASLNACSRAGDPRHSNYPEGAEHYRLLEETDFCGELPLFAGTDPKTMIGTVLDGAQRYVDPRSGRELRAIRVLTVMNDRRVDRWYARGKLVGHVYVLRDDPHFTRCGYWLEREEPVKPLATEIAAE